MMREGESDMNESIAIVMAVLRERVRQVRESSEAGAVSMEQVVITAGLLGLALLVVAAIVAAVNGRLSGIF